MATATIIPQTGSVWSAVVARSASEAGASACARRSWTISARMLRATSSGKRAPWLPASRIPYLDPLQVGDHKVVWELNRHQHLVTLAQEYNRTDYMVLCVVLYAVLGLIFDGIVRVIEKFAMPWRGQVAVR